MFVAAPTAVGPQSPFRTLTISGQVPSDRTISARAGERRFVGLAVGLLAIGGWRRRRRAR